MKRIVLILCILTLGIAMIGCNGNDYKEPVKTLLVVESDLEFDAKGGAGKILTVSDKGGIAAKSNKEWCTVTLSGMRVDVSVIANPNFVNRTALITITSGNETAYVPVTQSSTLFVIDDLALHYLWNGQTLETGYRSESAVTVSTTESAWITPTVNATDSKIVIVVAENPMGTSRSGSIKVESGGITQVIEITQDLQVILYAKLLGKWAMSSTTVAGVANPDEEITFTKKTDGSVFTTASWQGGAMYEIGYNKNTGALTLAMAQYAYMNGLNTLKLVGYDNMEGYISFDSKVSVTGTWNKDSVAPVYTFADNGSWADYVVRAIGLGEFYPNGDFAGKIYNTIANVKLTKIIE